VRRGAPARPARAGAGAQRVWRAEWHQRAGQPRRVERPAASCVVQQRSVAEQRPPPAHRGASGRRVEPPGGHLCASARRRWNRERVRTECLPRLDDVASSWCLAFPLLLAALLASASEAQTVPRVRGEHITADRAVCRHLEASSPMVQPSWQRCNRLLQRTRARGPLVQPCSQRLEMRLASPRPAFPHAAEAWIGSFLHSTERGDKRQNS